MIATSVDFSFELALLVILTGGLVSALVSKRFGASLLVGYLLAGVAIRQFVFPELEKRPHELQLIAEGGVLLLLFSIGLELSIVELAQFGRHLLIGGSVQMSLVALPTFLVLYLLVGWSWQASLIVGLAVALSSTVIVFKSLAETGHGVSAQGRRAISILLFQDVALVPLLLVVPLIAGGKGQENPLLRGLGLILMAGLLVGAVWLLRYILRRWVAGRLANLRSPELVVLFALVLFGSLTMATHAVGLSVVMGAFAAGLALSDGRLTKQVDALILPFRETFSAVFFVSLGLLLEPKLIWEMPLLVVGLLAAVIVGKMIAAGLALRLTGLGWRMAFGTGLGLAHLGEFSFVLASTANEDGIISDFQYDLVLLIALLSLILTPQLLRWGMRWGKGAGEVEAVTGKPLITFEQGSPEALVIGIGPAGRQVVSRLEMEGYDVCGVDMSPVNLHELSMQGFRTVGGDATDEVVLRDAGAQNAKIVVVCVPDDQVAVRVVRLVRQMNRKCRLLVRCRYVTNTSVLRSSGANAVLSEESVISLALLDALALLKPAE
ncbi:Inner membrane protein YbaL [Planctomycetes bacterium Pan216]|uniref:Inner membrane protein YbaL n=1 Tax=Kolteria novifilia TaxID=2527975 RepID=A0A518B6S3_9BACT|nr:Inner membrane protein YbaL [Planctomycetes bacterium Pan216]